MLKPNLNNVTLQISAGFVSQFPKDPLPKVAFSGRSNVGKSSLITAFFAGRVWLGSPLPPARP